MMKPRALVISTAGMDFGIEPDSRDAEGRVSYARSYDLFPGGKGAVLAAALSEYGAETFLCAKLGDDFFGQRLRTLFPKLGINVRSVILEQGMKTAFSEKYSDGGSYRKTVCRGAGQYLRPDEVDDALTCCPDAIFVQFEVQSNAILAASDYAGSNGVPLFIDASDTNMEIPLDRLQNVEVFCPNEQSVYRLTGLRLRTPDDCLRAAVLLSNRVRAKYIVIRMGERGIFLYDGVRTEFVTAYDVPVLDTSYAGDIFFGAMSMRYLQNGKNISEAVNYGNFVAAISVQKHGGLSTVPKQREIDELLADYKPEDAE
ncbi:MAG: PfkB family carbohydrate kinase [Lachnospiraceae bacterium]|nr:PfkB family carbohydrate kinase [Lachnospiraceae bacterium]